MSDQMDKMEGMQEIGTEQTAKEKRAAKKKERAAKKASGTGKKHRKAWIAAIAAVAVIGVGLYVRVSSSKVLPSVLCQAAAVGDVEETLSEAARWAVRKPRPTMRRSARLCRSSMSKKVTRYIREMFW